MQNLWNITIDDYLEVVKRAKEAGIKAGESMETIFLEYMEEKGQKSFGATELTKEELANDLAQKHGNILSIETDSQGVQSYKVTKKSDDIEE